MSATIPNYRLLEKIGEGGFGEVWLAETVTGKRRAVKVVHRERFQRPELTGEEMDGLFEREFQGVQRFEDLASDHPALIDVQHVGRDPDGEFYYYAMPLADNALDADSGRYEPLNLERRLLRDGSLDWDEALGLVRELGGGLDRLHRAGLCHGDVSSANVLLVDGRPVLADPGLTAGTGGERLTRSPGFSDPSPSAATTPRGDVFALGRLLYHALTGLHPAESFPLVPADRLRALPAAELADLLDRCCDPEPARRFADAGEFLAALSPEPSSQEPGPARRWRRPLLITASIAGLAIVSAIFLASKRPPLVPDLVKIEDNRLIAYAGNPRREIWSREPGHIADATLSDLDGDGVPEVLCAVAHLNLEARDGGRLVVYNADGSERWHFDTTREFQNFPQFEDDEMACTGVMAADWDGHPGKELVVISRNASGWFPCALYFLSSEGEWRSTYWHPGHLHKKDLRFVREKPGAPLYLAFKAFNNGLGASFKSIPPGKQKHSTTIGLLDPSEPGRHNSPPGHGKLGDQDQMTRFYLRIAPQWVDSRPPYAKDTNGDGFQELVFWSTFGSVKEFTDERVHFCWNLDFEGRVVSTAAGDGHLGEVNLEEP